MVARRCAARVTVTPHETQKLASPLAKWKTAAATPRR